jgi:hypothetical protein
VVVGGGVRASGAGLSGRIAAPRSQTAGRNEVVLLMDNRVGRTKPQSGNRGILYSKRL